MSRSAQHIAAVIVELREMLGASESEGHRIDEAADVMDELLHEREALSATVAHLQTVAVELNQDVNAARTLRAVDEWTEETGDVLLYRWPITESPWVGKPRNDYSQTPVTHFIALPDPATLFLPPT